MMQQDYPIKPSTDVVDNPIIAVNRWSIIDSTGYLTKIYEFRNLEMRNSFVKTLLNYEKTVQHLSIMTIDDLRVKIELMTKDINEVTNVDKEYARFADVAYKDIVYNLSHE